MVRTDREGWSGSIRVSRTATPCTDCNSARPASGRSAASTHGRSSRAGVGARDVFEEMAESAAARYPRGPIRSIYNALTRANGPRVTSVTAGKAEGGTVLAERPWNSRSWLIHAGPPLPSMAARVSGSVGKRPFGKLGRRTNYQRWMCRAANRRATEMLRLTGSGALGRVVVDGSSANAKAAAASALKTAGRLPLSEPAWVAGRRMPGGRQQWPQCPEFAVCGGRHEGTHRS
jgi:hypothetical protein